MWTKSTEQDLCRPSVRLSVRPPVRPYDLDYPHDNSVNIFQIFFEPWLEYSLGKYLGQVRPLISQLIVYAHTGLTSDFDIFDIPEVFFFEARAFKVDTVGPFSGLLDMNYGKYKIPMFELRCFTSLYMRYCNARALSAQ